MAFRKTFQQFFCIWYVNNTPINTSPEVTLIIDASSRKLVGWAFSLSENQIAVGESLGNAMIKHGKPLIYYSDNGSEQTAKSLDCQIGGMMARLGVEHQTGTPGNPHY